MPRVISGITGHIVRIHVQNYLILPVSLREHTFLPVHVFHLFHVDEKTISTPSASLFISRSLQMLLTFQNRKVNLPAAFNRCRKEAGRSSACRYGDNFKPGMTVKNGNENANQPSRCLLGTNLQLSAHQITFNIFGSKITVGDHYSLEHVF